MESNKEEPVGTCLRNGDGDSIVGGMCAAEFFEFHQKVRARGGKGGGKPRSAAEGGAASRLGEPLSVSQLTELIQQALDDRLPTTVLLKGEVSNYKHHGGSGHLYFTLKDSQTCIDCVMFRGDAQRLRFTPKDGMEMLATGRVGIYGQRGRYQLYVSRLEPLGQGALELAFRQMCEKLQRQGLFGAERKKPIPAYPQRIVLLTSAQTAALQDMLKVLRRFGWLHLLVHHVPVQGDGSAEKIAAAIEDLNRWRAGLGGIDVILLARGGGSLEDLWEFNEEVLARAIADSQTPIVTGIGHEIDVSVADLVADYHAHTPTEAAQVITAQWRIARDSVDALGIRMRRETRRLLQQCAEQIRSIRRHEAFRRPMDRINRLRELLDDRQRAMAAALQRDAQGRRAELAAWAARLDRCGPQHAVELNRERVAHLRRELVRSMEELHRRWRQTAEAMAGQLQALSPQAVLRRGYSITTLKKGGALVRRADQVKPGDRLVTQVADGLIESTADDQRQLRLFD